MHLVNFISVTLLNTYVKVVFRMKTVNWYRLGGLGLSVDHERRCENAAGVLPTVVVNCILDVFYLLLSSIAFWTVFYLLLLLIAFQLVFHLLLS